MSLQIWKARWLENGQPRELVFRSVNSRMIAKIDFRLKYPHAFQNGIAPKKFDIEEEQTSYARTTLLRF